MSEIKVLTLLANGFEETEYVAVRDVLIGEGHIVDSVSMSNEKLVNANHNIKIMADYTMNEIMNNLFYYDALFIPGGQGVKVLDQIPEFDSILDHFITNNKIIGAICDGPTLLAKRGLMKGIKSVVYPSKESISILKSNGVKYQKDLNFIGDKQFFTGKNMQTSVEFGYEFSKYLK